MKTKATDVKEIIDYDYFFEYDYDKSHNCGSSCDDYCRCGKINNLVLKKIDYDSILNLINVGRHLTVKTVYCLERIIKKLITVETIELYAVKSYYGEEVECHLNKETKNKLVEFINFVLDNADNNFNKCIELALKLDYGYVLEDLKDQCWEIKIVNIEQVRVPYVKTNQKIIDSYSGDEIVLCQTINDNCYRLIDGNHRFAAAKRAEKKEIKILTTVKL